MKHFARILLFIICTLPLVFRAAPQRKGYSSALAGEFSSADSLANRTVLILRHAKSDHANSLADFDRPLSNDGLREAAEMGAYMKEYVAPPDLIIASPSVRTRQTIEIVCRIADYPFSSVQWDSSLYQCKSPHFIDLIRRIDPKYRSVLVVGHNSAVTDVVNTLQSKTRFSEIKTCGLVQIDFENCSWSSVGTVKGALVFYHKPR
jgi:phosphohistidine phosphatase